jgi:hypothetical protein
MTTATQKTVSLSDIRRCAKTAYLASLSERGFHFVRVRPDGSVYASEDSSNSRLADEFDGRTPCTTTIAAFENRETFTDEQIAAEEEGGSWEDWFDANVTDLESKLESTGCTLVD